MAGYGPKALSLTGRKADGFILQLADPVILEWTMRHVHDAAKEAGRDPKDVKVCVAAPAYVGDDLAHQREQCRWFGGMVGNHVADLVARYGEDSEVPHALTDYIKSPRGLRRQPPRQGGQRLDQLRPGQHSGPLLRARHRRGPRSEAKRTQRNSAWTSSTSTSCTTLWRRRFKAYGGGDHTGSGGEVQKCM